MYSLERNLSYDGLVYRLVYRLSFVIDIDYVRAERQSTQSVSCAGLLEAPWLFLNGVLQSTPMVAVG